jgi:hypothetical protein
MGFRRFVINEALLAKQGWRLITHPNSLVAQILKAKYYHKEHLLKAKAKPNMSYTWRSIDLWDDNWIHQRGNTSTWSPKPASTTYQKVQDIINNTGNDWNTQVINHLFIFLEAQKILQIPIFDKSQEDTLTWDGTPDENYTVKLGYQFDK